MAHNQFLDLKKDDIKAFYKAEHEKKVLMDIKGLFDRKEFEKDFNGFISNLLKLSMTLLGILATIVAVGILSIISWVGFCLYLKFKKS